MKLLTQNVGRIDRILRVVVGIGLLSLVFIGPETAWGLIGLIPLVTAFVGSCPVYTLLGIRTCPMKAGPVG